MNATLLCPGPSLAGYDPANRRGIVVGVNRAAQRFVCDVWSACDIGTLKRVQPLGHPILLTIAATRDSLARRGRPWPWLVVTHDGIAGDLVTNSTHPWTRFSATAALKYLLWTGATRIDVYGADMAGEMDWDGELAGERRTEDRWADERMIWQQTVAAGGAEVIRHTWA